MASPIQIRRAPTHPTSVPFKPVRGDYNAGGYTLAKASKPKLKDSYGLYINGKWVAASDKGTFETHNPANGEKLADCAEATKKDVDKAVKAAWKAFDSWKRVDPSVRSKILLDIADRIDWT